MNFFGHAWVARRRRDDAAFVLGAMLPDLAPLCGAVVAAPLEGALADGVAHHHETDAVFHAAPTFQRLVCETVTALRASGVARGGARGAAHVALELLLDGALAADAAACAAFRRALAEGAATLRFADAPSAGRFARLATRLAGGGVPGAYADPGFVAERVCGALSHRPRLALDQQARVTILAALPDLAARVHASAAALMAELDAGLLLRAA